MNGSPTPSWTWIGRTARAIACTCLAYWALFTLLAPVTVWDSHVYNLGRLPLAELGGLWSNPYWTSERQVAFPLSFDAIHLPLLHLGAGFALPSFLCLLGILGIAWSALHRWHGRDTAWLGVLALLSLPTLVFQSVGTKNDLAVLFGVAVWFHALSRWTQEEKRRHLVFAAIAIGFMAGAKSSGLVTAILSSVATLWVLRKNRAPLITFAGMLLMSLAALGSVETYVVNQRASGHPLGSEGFLRDHRNNDGISGAFANTARYIMANLSTGAEPWLEPDPITPWMEQRCRDFLRVTGLADSGYRGDYDDSRLRFIRGGWDAASDFGPIGTLGLMLAPIALIWWSPRARWWRLTFIAFLLLGSVAFTAPWMPWNNRFLMPTFSLLTVAVVSLAAQLGPKLLSVILLAISTYAAVVYPLTSYNKRPADLVAAIKTPEVQEFKERPSLLPVINAVRDWRQSHPGGEVLMVAGSDSWVLPFLTSGRLAIRPVQINDLSSELASKQRQSAPALILVMNRPDFRRSGLPLRQVASFPAEEGTSLYELVASSADLLPTLQWETGHFSDDWIAGESSCTLEHWTSGQLVLALWNPAPLVRTLRLKTQSSEQVVKFQPGEHLRLVLSVASSDTVTLSVTPTFQPSASGTSVDSRQLGLHVVVTEGLPSPR